MARPAGQNGQTTQLMKTRFPPTWSGQSFEKWRKEVEKWTQNNKSTEEDKFIDLMESLKKNERVNQYITKTLLEKIKDEREVKKVLDLLAEKYSRMVCEMIKEVEKKIIDFKTGEKVDLLIDRFEEMVTEMDALEYA